MMASLYAGSLPPICRICAILKTLSSSLTREDSAIFIIIIVSSPNYNSIKSHLNFLSINMAKAFLAQLVTIEEPRDEQCMICIEAYGTTVSDGAVAEKAVRLPCGHVLGSECIALWLLPEKSNQNSCPCCRSELFALPRIGNNGDDGDEPEDEPAWRFRQWREEWDVILGTLNTQGNIYLEAQWQQWRTDWNTAATHELEHDSIQTATAARNLLGTQLGLSQGFFDKINREWPIAEVALSLQTLRFRECRLYNHLAAGSSQYLHTPPTYSISKEQEDWLFKELKRCGAFCGVLGSVARKRERWDILRRQGLVWDLTEGVWYSTAY